MSLVVIPANVAALATLCKEGAGRFALSGIHVESSGDTYTVTATTGSVLAQVRGPNDQWFPPFPGDTFGPGSAASAILPAKDFVTACRDIKKGGKNAVAVKMMEKESLLAIAGERVSETTYVDVRTRPNVEGRFPATASVIVDARKEATHKIKVNPLYLAEVLEAAAAILTSFKGDAVGVTLSFGDGHTPIVIEGKNADGQEFVGIVMPRT